MVRRLRPLRPKTAPAAIVFAASLVGLGGCVAGQRGLDSGYAGTPVVPAKPAPDAELIGRRGQPARIFNGNAGATFLFFGYAHCPDECPLALASLGGAYRQLPTATAHRIRIVFITVDPARDTPAALDTYVRKFDPHIAGLTGSPAALSRVWRAYGVTVDPTSHEIGHGDQIYAADRKRHVVLIYPPDASASDLAKDAERLANR